MKLFTIFFALFLCALTSCSLVDPASPEAGYIEIDSIPLTTDELTQGSSSAAITDAWIILDDGYLGTFPLPAKIPVIGNGNKKIILKAGIIENGIASVRSAYPKYISYDTTVLITPGKTTKLKPSISYYPTSVFPQLEDFNDASLTLVSTSSSSINLQVTSSGDPNAFEGNSGIVTLDNNHTIFEAATSTLIQFSQIVPTYIELNYKSDNDFTIGVYVTTASGGVEKRTLLSLRSSSVWKKVYISVADLGGMATNALGYKVFVRCEKNSALTTATLYLDNLKVVY